MGLFNEKIENWHDWGMIYQSIPAFQPLIEYIIRKEGLPVVGLENLMPGTNAVFKAGGYVVKVFAPGESGIDQTVDLQTELFSTRRANELGIPSPRLVANGHVDDKYRFAYMITDYIHGVELDKVFRSLPGNTKIAIGKRLREITDAINTPCRSFNGIDAISDKMRYRRWDKYPECFKAERLAYITNHDFGGKVFVHGDLCMDNIILAWPGDHGNGNPADAQTNGMRKMAYANCSSFMDGQGLAQGWDLYIIDFADALLAPLCYEHALVAFSFELDPMLLRGYFPEYMHGGNLLDSFTSMLYNGLLIHDFGGDIVRDSVCGIDDIQCIYDLSDRLANLLKKKQLS